MVFLKIRWLGAPAVILAIALAVGTAEALPSAGGNKITNGIGMTLILIPAGEFQMGANDGADGEKPVHTVKITRPFYLSATEVTQAQYEAVMGVNPSQFTGNDLPVEGVSWDDAVEFCKKLSTKEKATYRLPTEAEWEYACRAGTKTAYSFGDEAGSLGDYAWFDGNSGGKTHPVGQKKPNAWGLFDMHGNVWEWCSDWYGSYNAAAVTDPGGPATGENRVLRGGSWISTSQICRAADRDGSRPGYRRRDLGFRLALSRVQ